MFIHLPNPWIVLGLHACVVIYVQLVGACVCIDPRLGWEPCFVPAWLINGVVMAVGRNEGTERRRSASQDPCSWPGTHTVSNTNTNSRCTLYTFLTVMLVAQIRLSVYFSCILNPSLLLNYTSPLCSCHRILSLFLSFLTCVITSLPLTLLLYIVGPLSFLPVAIFTSCFPSAHHLLLSPSLPLCPLLPPLALPDVTLRLSTAAEVKPWACSVCVHACIIILCCYMYFLCV